MSLPKILFVEDDPLDCGLCIAALSSYEASGFYQTVFLRDGSEVMLYLQSTDQLPKVILLDLKMSKVNGVEVIIRVRAVPEFLFIPIVVFSSSDLQKDIADCYKAGANAYVVKPMGFPAFKSILQATAAFWTQVNLIGGK